MKIWLVRQHKSLVSFKTCNSKQIKSKHNKTSAKTIKKSNITTIPRNVSQTTLIFQHKGRE